MALESIYLAAGVVNAPGGFWKVAEEMWTALKLENPSHELVRMGAFEDDEFSYKKEFTERFLNPETTSKRNPWELYGKELEKVLDLQNNRLVEIYRKLQAITPLHELLGLMEIDENSHSILLREPFNKRCVRDSEKTPYLGLVRYKRALDSAKDGQPYQLIDTNPPVDF